jgi:hypothetical protein
VVQQLPVLAQAQHLAEEGDGLLAQNLRVACRGTKNRCTLSCACCGRLKMG